MPFKSEILAVAVFVLVLIVPVGALAAAPISDDDSDDAPAAIDNAGTEKTVDQIAREMSNPLAAFTSGTYQFDYRSYQGDIDGAGDDNSMTHLIGGVFPFMQKDGQGFVFRFMLPVNVGWAILMAAGLSFVGAGIRPPAPEWGSMIALGAPLLMTGQWWVALSPGLAIGICVLGLALLANALEVLLDPTRL